MGRADVQNLRPKGRQVLRFHALLIHAGQYTVCSVYAVNLPDAVIARILYAEPFVPAEKLNKQTVQILGARADNNLLRLNGQAAKTPEMIGDRLPERKRAESRRPLHQRLSLPVHHLAQQPCPRSERELPRLDAVCRKSASHSLCSLCGSSGSGCRAVFAPPAEFSLLTDHVRYKKPLRAFA